jgi:hypothetical protein
LSLSCKPLDIHWRDSDMKLTYTWPHSDMSFATQIPADRKIYAFEKLSFEYPEKLKYIYSPNPCSYIDVTLTWSCHISDLILTWALSLRFLQIGRYVPLNSWLSNNLEKLKELYPPTPWSYIDKTLPWRWHTRYLKVTKVLPLTFLQIGRYVPLKHCISNNIEKFKCLFPANPWTYIDVTQTRSWYIRYLKVT